MIDNYTLKPGPIVPQEQVDMMVNEYEGGCGEAHLYGLLCELAYSHTALQQKLDFLRRYHGGDGTITREQVIETLGG